MRDRAPQGEAPFLAEALVETSVVCYLWYFCLFVSLRRFCSAIACSLIKQEVEAIL